jgi:N-acyl homoserine lactone hydrolase
MKKLIAAALAFAGLTGMQAPQQAQAKLSLYRLDCGTFTIKDYNAFFSDTMAYKPGPKDITDSCYLIRNGDRMLLWDTGIGAELAGKTTDAGFAVMKLGKTLVQQLGEIGVTPEQVEMVGISHFHSDHIGQAAAFPQAKLLIGADDLAAFKATPPHPQLEPARLKPWLQDGATAVPVSGDHDVFGDGRVIMLNMPGHTPGHHALLVGLASGPVLLTGDLYHFTEQVAHKGVPPFNTNRADTLASMDRFDKLAKNIGAKVIIQHEAADIAKLPAFPKATE